MKINTKATNITLEADVHEYLEKKIQSLSKFVNLNDDAVMIDAELGKTTRHHQAGDIFRAEINLHTPGKSYRAVSEATELYAAIDDVKDEILRELETQKRKRLHLLRRGGQKVKDFIKGFYKWGKK